MRRKETKEKKTYSLGWAMKNCVPGWGIAAETFARTRKEAQANKITYFDSADCVGCKVVRVRIIEERTKVKG